MSELWRPLAVGTVGSLALWLLLSLSLRNLERGAAAAAVLVGSFYGYGVLSGLSLWPKNSSQTLIAWGIVTLLAACLAAWKWKWHAPALFFSVVLTAIPIGKIVLALAQAPKIRTVQSGAQGASGAAKPDVIYIVLDGYGRTDVFRSKYGFSDDAFIKGLEERGFYVAHQAHSNYCQTELSIGSALNADLWQNLVSKEAHNRGTLRQRLVESVVFQRFRQEGYIVSKISTGFPAIKEVQADQEISKTEGLSLLESTILDMTPAGQNPELGGSMFVQRRTFLLNAFESLGTLGGQAGRPRFTFAHILAPHPPFSFGPNGEPMPKARIFGYWDGSDFMERAGSPDEYTKGYSGQAIFVGKKILAALDKILATPGPKPIIILQGDHGPKRGLDQSSAEKTDPRECFPILNAYLVPGNIRRELYPSITPVNSFRTLMRSLFGDKLPNLPDRSWYSPYGEPFRFTEITDKLKHSP
jgi:hypothetical protein